MDVSKAGLRAAFGRLPEERRAEVLGMAEALAYVQGVVVVKDAPAADRPRKLGAAGAARTAL